MFYFFFATFCCFIPVLRFFQILRMTIINALAWGKTLNLGKKDANKISRMKNTSSSAGSFIPELDNSHKSSKKNCVNLKKVSHEIAKNEKSSMTHTMTNVIQFY